MKHALRADDNRYSERKHDCTIATLQNSGRLTANDDVDEGRGCWKHLGQNDESKIAVNLQLTFRLFCSQKEKNFMSSNRMLTYSKQSTRIEQIQHHSATAMY
uniref:Uncharacterized protein n=1 Tax=Parascaris univalens TaxID=6257 RepID=A0A915BZ10_PARUN